MNLFHFYFPVSVCFKIFDTDRDGVLNYSEIAIMVECMNQVRNQVLNEDSKLKIDANEVTKDILEKHDPQKTGALTMEEFLVWTVNNPLPAEFSKLIFQLCHIVLGLRPISRSDEGEIVQGWLDRETSVSYSVGSIWHLINMEWWTHWKTYVNHQVGLL